MWSLEFGDGVSNCIFSISRILDEFHYSNRIISFYIDERVKKKNVEKLKNIYEPISIDEDDIVIYHFSIGCPLNYIVEHMQCKKILVYQNVTTPDFFRGIDDEVFKLCLWGVYDASKTAGRYLKSIVMSEFNKNELVRMGWDSEDVFILPLIKTENTELSRNDELVNRYKDDFVNILFTGRIVPNKKIEDIIKIFSYYHKNINRKSRLILVGGIRYQNYYEALVDYTHLLGIDNVIFTGHVANEDLEAYYAVSDVFLCMSEHEGFCIPLVEAMKRKIPIIAYAATAVPNTLGEAGIIVDTKNEEKVAELIDQVVSNLEFRTQIINLQKKRLGGLSLENYRADIKAIIDEISQLETYSYTFELRSISVSYPDKSRQDKIESLSENLRQILSKEEKVIIYGMGKAGRNILTLCDKFDSTLLERIAICDNSIAEQMYNDIPVFCQEECIKRFPRALYIVTVQNSCVEIIADLINNHIEKDNIKFFNFSAQKIV